MTILAYDGQGRLVRQWEKRGARYVVSIKLTRDKVEFIGQGGLRVFVWNDTDNWLTLGTETPFRRPRVLKAWARYYCLFSE
jgi:hypothetical protein